MPIVTLTGTVDGITIRVSADGRTQAEALAAAKRLLTRRERQVAEWLVSEQIDAEAHAAGVSRGDA